LGPFNLANNSEGLYFTPQICFKFDEKGPLSMILDGICDDRIFEKEKC
jgi:hypothetical protein